MRPTRSSWVFSGVKNLEQKEQTADALEEFGRYFLVHFNRNLSILSINAPEQVRKDGNFYKYLKLEQKTEPFSTS